MIPQPSGVELTKVHYYDEARKARNLSVSTISREVCQNDFNRNVIIKRNVFGHRWVLKINEDGERRLKKGGKVKLVVYILVFCSIVVAVGFGIFFSVDKNFFKTNHTIIHLRPSRNDTENYFYKTHENQIMQVSSSSNETILKGSTTNKNDTVQNSICTLCNPQVDVCLKVQEVDMPKCMRILDRKDPTGCGGHCPINTHFCHVLDAGQRVYQCLKLRNTLKCPDEAFNCGNRCISMEKRCDGVVHCSNFSDELNCACDLTTHFQCSNHTSCLEKSKKCDKKIDCWDKSDETDCNEVPTCEAGETPCQDSLCIPVEQFCNGEYDCPDKSDEPEGCHP